MIKGGLILGAGGNTSRVIELLNALNYKISGIIDNDSTLKGKEYFGVKVLGNENLLESIDFNKDDFFLVNGLGSINKTTARRNLYNKFEERGYVFPYFIHPTATVSKDVKISEGTLIYPHACIGPGVVIGHNVLVNTGAIIEHHCSIGKHTHISPNSTICGSVKIEESVHIGASSTIIQNIHIGADSIIGAGSVVVRDVEAGSKVKGIPAK